MSTETIEQERLVATPDSHVLFMCRRSDLRLVKTPRYPRYGPGGQQVGEKPGEVVAFRDGTLRVPRTGMAILEDGRQVDAEEIVEWLEGHRLFTDSEDGFWRVDPTAPPVSQAEIDALNDIVLDLDEDKLLAFIEQERAGWGRDDLLASAERVLERMRALKAQAEKG